MIYELINTDDALKYIAYLLTNGFAFEVRPHTSRITVSTSEKADPPTAHGVLVYWEAPCK
jgi:hypothetical protein